MQVKVKLFVEFLNYYIMKKLFVFIGLLLGCSFFMPNVVHAQSCPNINFSQANFNYWQCYLGTCNSEVKIAKSAHTPGRHSIMDAALLTLTNQMPDERCQKINKVPAGFAYSARVGNSEVGAEMEAIEYTLTVDSTNSLLILHFAWVMEDPSHSPAEQPKFSMTVRDTNGIAIPGIPCGHVDFTASQDLPDLECKTSSLLARNWTTVGYSLEPLIGQKIKIYFETRDCTPTGHFGYAYVVAECRPMSIDLTYCEGSVAARMRAPEGFASYRWTRSSNQFWVYEGAGRQYQNIVVPDPYNDEIFTCEVRSALGAECSSTLKTVVVMTTIDANFQYGVMENGRVDFLKHNYENWYDTCNRTATFVDFTTVTNSIKSSILWEIHGLNVANNDSLFTYTFPDPDTVTTYLVRLSVTSENGCADSSKLRAQHYITIYPSPRIEIVGDTQMCEGDEIPLVAVARRSEFIEYTWTDTAGNILGKGDAITVTKPGRYYILAKDIAGCYARDTHIIVNLIPIMDVTTRAVDCFGNATGVITHGRISGGQPPYDPMRWYYEDLDGNREIFRAQGNQNGETFLNLKAGTYIFEAIDNRNCTMEGFVIVTQPDSLMIIGTHEPTTCGFDNGKIKLTAVGGVPPYRWRILKEDGTTVVSTAENAENVAAEKHVLEVTDANGCMTVDTIEVTALPIPYVEIIKVGIETCESGNGEIQVLPRDALQPVKYTWNTGEEGDTSNVVGSLKAGTYTLTIVDGNKCEVTTDIVVESFPTPIVTIAKVPEVCNREDGTITITVNSAEPNTLKYIWEGRSEIGTTLVGLKAGAYKVTVRDTFCVVDTIIVIDHINGPIANFEANAYNVASNTIFTLTDISQGTVATWNWDMGDGNEQAGKIVFYTYGKSGDYIVFLEVLDTNNCVDTISKVIHVYDELNVFIPNMFTPNGDGLNEKWKPVMSEYAREGYQLSIFDRWGQLIFYTTDTNEEWDGSVDGRIVASNTVYSYRVLVRDFTGQEYEFVGQVMVIR